MSSLFSRPASRSWVAGSVFAVTQPSPSFAPGPQKSLKHLHIAHFNWIPKTESDSEKTLTKRSSPLLAPFILSKTHICQDLKKF
jgi:hypothetical protein